MNLQVHGASPEALGPKVLKSRIATSSVSGPESQNPKPNSASLHPTWRFMGGYKSPNMRYKYS